MSNKLDPSMNIMGVGTVTLGLLGVWFFPDHPAKGQEAAAVPIPELRRWEENMKKSGVKHGAEKGYAISAGYASEAYVWYYDGPRVFYRIADYTGDPKWTEFAENCMETYRAYVFALNGKVPGWRVFPHGLYLHFQRTGDEKSKEAVILLSKNAKYAPLGGGPGEEQSRETAYCINAYLVADALGEPRHPKLEQAFGYALGHIDQWFVQNSSQNWAPFMFGLTCEALISYHDKVRKDPRILPAIKMGLDECWKRAWIEEHQAFFYRADNPTGAAPGLNLLVAPAFAWVYLQTGDITYRDRGDKVFAGGVRGAYLDGGKQFSQNYRWSFDYVKWRTEAAGGPTGLTVPGLPSPAVGGLGAGVAKPPMAPGVKEQRPRLPEGTGLAAKYPGDVGIERDPAVLFAESFEKGSLEEIGRRWGNLSNKDGKVIAFCDDVPPGSTGKRSLQMTATLGQNTGGHLYTRLVRGVDTAFVRLYVKFDAEQFAFPCGVHFGGHNPPTAWPQGNPGRPHGDERMMVEFGPVSESGKHAPPGVWGISGFWSEMKASADGNYWGNLLSPARPMPVASDRWQCLEVMLKCNSAPEKSDLPAATAAQADGELALWLDGRLQMHIKPGVRRGPWSGMGFSLVEQGGSPREILRQGGEGALGNAVISRGEAFEGFRWRTSTDLKVNFFWLLHNVTEAAMRQNKVTVSRVWFDDIVVSTAYIGPIQEPTHKPKYSQ